MKTSQTSCYFEVRISSQCCSCGEPSEWIYLLIKRRSSWLLKYKARSELARCTSINRVLPVDHSWAEDIIAKLASLRVPVVVPSNTLTDDGEDVDEEC